ncbi:MAG TPA: prolyl oligopeptidase family serine peptidase [Candidatus Paceibacterota bacterium]|jgi:prolyl oligopeptidase
MYARRSDFKETLHGTEVTDPYRWLEGDPSDPEIYAWLTQEGARAREYFDNLSVREMLRDELKSLASYDTWNAPVPRCGRYFYLHRKTGEDMAVLYVKEGLKGTPRVLIDPNKLSTSKTTVLAEWTPSRNGELLAYALSYAGNDKKELRLIDVSTGKDLPDRVLDDVYPELGTWGFEGAGFWYTRRDPQAPLEEAKFHKRVYFHTVGTDTNEDTQVWGKGFEKEWFPAVRLSSDGQYLVGNLHGQQGGQEWSEVYVKNLKEPESEFVLVLPRVLGTLAYASAHRELLYVLTNNGAPKWKLISCSLSGAVSGSVKFTDVVIEGDDVIEGYALVQDRLFVHKLRNVQGVVQEHTLAGEVLRELPLPVAGTVSGFTKEGEGNELFFLFASFAYPPTVYRIGVPDGELEIIEQATPPFDPSAITTQQVWYTSKDGTPVPMFLVYKEGLEKNSDNPTMLYGYGGFDVSLRPGFLVHALPFITRGGVFAIANLRGGGEFGRDWHEAGMKKNKQNVFDDFIAAAEFLVRERYTAQDRLAIMGGSNGGLLVAATMAQRPDLVRAVVCRVPVADMLRYHLHLGGRHWIPDYGDPDNPEMFKYLLGYSPYHNLKDGERYPATLVMTSDHDDRVHPLHAYKFAARLIEANASEYPTLMRVEMQAGHGGALSVSRAAEQDADMWAFVFDQLGVRK